MTIEVQAFAQVGKYLQSVPRDADSASHWKILYPGQVFSTSPLELDANRMNNFRVESIASAMARVYEAGRRAAFAELRQLIGA